jgi:hypothetical protein
MDGLESWELGQLLACAVWRTQRRLERDEVVGWAIDAFIIHGEHVGTDITVHMISGVHGQTKSSLAGSQLLNGKWLAGSWCSFGNAVAVRRRQMTCDSEMRGRPRSWHGLVLAHTGHLIFQVRTDVLFMFALSTAKEHVGLCVGNVLSASCRSFLFSNAYFSLFLI